MAKDTITLDRETYRQLLWGTYMALARHINPMKQSTALDLLPHLREIGQNSNEGLIQGIRNMASCAPEELEAEITKEENDDGE